MSDYTDISDQILDGTLDAVLDSLQEDILMRRKVIGRKRAAQVANMPDGTRVRLVRVSPKKANGATGVLTHDTWNGKLGIRMDRTITSRIQAGEAYTWPAECYEVIDDDAE